MLDEMGGDTSEEICRQAAATSTDDHHVHVLLFGELAKGRTGRARQHLGMHRAGTVEPGRERRQPRSGGIDVGAGILFGCLEVHNSGEHEHARPWPEESDGFRQRAFRRGGSVEPDQDTGPGDFGDATRRCAPGPDGSQVRTALHAFGGDGHEERTER
nr:hypothetical protein CPGR_02261 [Mycolicibacterium malmesburyense]